MASLSRRETVAVGWTNSYTWSQIDNATWTGFLTLQLYCSLVLLNEAFFSHKKTLLWAIIFSSILSNMLGSISGFFLLDCLMFTGSESITCDTPLHVYYAFQAVIYLQTFWLLYYRKLKIAPEKLIKRGLLDTVILALSIASNLATNIPCMYSNIDYCFLQDVYQAGAVGLSFLFFDVWFLRQLMQKVYDAEEKRKKWDLLQTCLGTGGVSFVYLAGSISYKTFGGNFYTNILWNIGYCMVPLACVKSIMSPQFLKVISNSSASNTEAGKLTIPDLKIQTGTMIMQETSTITTMPNTPIGRGSINSLAMIKVPGSLNSDQDLIQGGPVLRTGSSRERRVSFDLATRRSSRTGSSAASALQVEHSFPPLPPKSV
ncbi:hypothetical protein BDR26DRAFT_852845, partial [Obelidium mucronatum]